jgi:exosortase
MPYRIETALRQPLQDLATKLSCVVLQITGLPAIAEANVIRIGDSQFGVEEACSGLRIFVGVGALAYAYLVVVRRSWSVKGLLLAALVPIALLTNCTRIVTTCILHERFSGDVAQKFSHDVAGLATIPFAFLLFGLLLWLLGHIVREERVTSLAEVVHGARA